MTTKYLGTVTILVGLVLTCGARSANGQGVGAIGGTVSDASGAVLPGATVSLSNVQGSVGGNQQSVTDERGTYQFLRLVPGTYVVKVELQGFRPAEQRGIVVNADVTARADLKLEIGGLQEGVVVSGEAPLLDTTSALRQTVLSRDVVNSLPNRGDIWAVARVIPGVVLNKVDVGGSESFVQSSVTVHGSSNENKYTIDGLDVTSLDGNATTANLYFDPYAFQESNFQMGGGSAEFSNGGVTINMISKTGTNQLHGGAMFNGANHQMGSTNYSTALRTQLLAGVPAAALKANPNIIPEADILKIYDTGGWLAGPLIRDALWFSFSGHDQALDQHILGSYDADGTQVLDDNRMWTYATKIAWQVTKSAQLSFFDNMQKKLIAHRNGGGTFADSHARQYNVQWPTVNQVKFTTPVSSKIVADVAYSRYRSDTRLTTRPEVKDGDISRFDSVTNTYTIALPTYRNTDHIRDQVFASFSYFAGRHDIRFGYQYTKDGENVNTFSTSGMRAVYRSGLPDSVNTYNTPAIFSPWSRHIGIYLQDKWTVTRKLTVNLGMRYETNDGWQRPACQPTTVFVQGQCFGEITAAPDFRGTPGRLSAVYDLFGDGKTALKFSANRYDQPIGIDFSARVNPVAAVSDTRAWTVCALGQTAGCDLNGDLVPQLNELGPSNGYSFGATNRYAPGLKWPASNELSGEVQRQLPGSVVLSVGYTRRQTRRNLAQRNMAVPAETYTALPVTEVNSGQAVTVYNQASTLRGKFDNLWSNEPAENTNYNGADITLTRHMSHGWSMTGGASFGRTHGDPVGGDLNNPNNGQFRKGIVGNDVPWSYRMSGVYEFPYQILFSATGQYYKGFPETTTVSVGNNTVTLTQGTTTVWTAPRGSTRLPNVSSLDVSIRKVWKAAGRSVEPRIDLYNLTNEASILSRVTQLGPSYHQASSIQRGRLIKLGLSVDF